jgi:hypothetical protein
MVSLSARRLQVLAAIPLLALNCLGCVLTTTHYDGGKTETRMTGFVHLDTYRLSGNESGMVVTRLRSIGIRIGGESGIGYFDDRNIYIPFDCRIVFLVQTDSQLLAAKKIIDGALDGRDPCVTRN